MTIKRSSLAIAVLLAAAILAARSAPELFQRARQEMKAGSWQQALETIDALDAEAAEPGNEDLRAKLSGPVTFYRGVCEANLDHGEKARADFAAFLAMQPNASIDPGLYSKKAIAAFESARKTAAPAGGIPGAGPSLFNAYQEFKAPPNISEQANVSWAEGPVQWIMTAEERAAWSELSSGGERSEFVDKFWLSRNPRPGKDDNSYRTGFERRAAFADTYFVQDEKKRGSLTDRGMVFVLLGPPNYGGRKTLGAAHDREESDGTKVVGTAVSSNGNKWFYSPSVPAPDSDTNFEEIWHYRRELLPKGVSYQQVDVTFLTKKGYGVNVLERESQTVRTLDAAKKQPEQYAKTSTTGEPRP